MRILITTHTGKPTNENIVESVEFDNVEEAGKFISKNILDGYYVERYHQMPYSPAWFFEMVYSPE